MPPARVAVIGAGWWSQGWHLVHLHNHPDVHLVAIVDTNPHPQSSLNPNLESLSVLGQKYGCPVYNSLTELLEKHDDLDGVLIATPHATHYELGMQTLQAGRRLHILMEKPMTVSLRQAQELARAVKVYCQEGTSFLINHSANFRPQTILARQIVTSGRIGTVRHVTAFLASPLSWIFEDPTNTGWNEPSGAMLGNGFAWGQSSHLLAWIYHVCSDLEPAQVFCSMTPSATTGADVAHAATVECRNGAVLSISGTSLLPGNAHSDPPVGKRVRLEVYGTTGALIYNGVDTDPDSGNLQVLDRDGKADVVHDKFEFEHLDNTGEGPASLQSWIDACQGKVDHYNGADCELGLKTVQTLTAMYESHATKKLVAVQHDASA